MEEMKVFELKPTSSIADPQSPRESNSVASITPSSEYGRTRGFFKDQYNQPQSTTNSTRGKFDLSKDNKPEFDFKDGRNVAATPKGLGSGIGFDDQEDDLLDNFDDDISSKKSAIPLSTKNSSAQKTKFVSTSAEKAKVAMAEKNKVNLGEGEDFEESRDLPQEEFIDFHLTYSENKWWGNKKVEPKEEDKDDSQL